MPILFVTLQSKKYYSLNTAKFMKQTFDSDFRIYLGYHFVKSYKRFGSAIRCAKKLAKDCSSLVEVWSIKNGYLYLVASFN